MPMPMYPTKREAVRSDADLVRFIILSPSSLFGYRRSRIRRWYRLVYMIPFFLSSVNRNFEIFRFRRPFIFPFRETRAFGIGNGFCRAPLAAVSISVALLGVSLRIPLFPCPCATEEKAVLDFVATECRSTKDQDFLFCPKILRKNCLCLV